MPVTRSKPGLAAQGSQAEMPVSRTPGDRSQANESLQQSNHLACCQPDTLCCYCERFVAQDTTQVALTQAIKGCEAELKRLRAAHLRDAKRFGTAETEQLSELQSLDAKLLNPAQGLHEAESRLRLARSSSWQSLLCHACTSSRCNAAVMLQ